MGRFSSGKDCKDVGKAAGDSSGCITIPIMMFIVIIIASLIISGILSLFGVDFNISAWIFKWIGRFFEWLSRAIRSLW
jgi:hypothetical protein